jgi:hypothetical protein
LREGRAEGEAAADDAGDPVVGAAASALGVVVLAPSTGAGTGELTDAMAVAELRGGEAS